MAKEIAEIIPDPEALLGLHPEELGGILLQVLINREKKKEKLNRHNFIGELFNQGSPYPGSYSTSIPRAIAEAWNWLLGEGLIAVDPGAGLTGGDWVFVTRLGHEIINTDSFEAFRKGSLLPRRILHPKIAEKVWSNFIRGDYETAIFQAFKEVEVAVRENGGFDNSKYGVSLMRLAFHPETGTLTDSSSPPSERQALSDLFSGSIGYYKNPSSHRTVIISEPIEAAEILIMASHLLRIIDSRRLG